MLRKVLIVTPAFAPVNAADSHRVRMSLPYYVDFGWAPTVLAVRPDRVEGSQDPLLQRGLPDDIPIVHSEAVPVSLTRPLGVGSLALRSVGFLASAGSRLLRRSRFDLVFFSSTVFLTFPLGLYWRHRFGVPYVVDYQDPWINEYYKTTRKSPPGGRFKHGATQLLAGAFEPRVLRRSGGVICVSPEYPRALRQRYPDIPEGRFAVIPFGAPERDFELLPTLNASQTIFDPKDGLRHWVYVGRGGPDMARSAAALFLAVKRLRDREPAVYSGLRMHFVGTSYVAGSGNAKPIQGLAESMGIGDLVEERPQRIPYFEALQVMRDSDATLVLGSDDPGYTASKVYPCILAARPLLAILHEKSSAGDVLSSTHAGSLVTFGDATGADAMAPRLMSELSRLIVLPRDYAPPTRWTALAPYTARHLTRLQCDMFTKALA